MFHRIRDYQLIYMSGQAYRPRVYGDPSADGRWDGWIVFFPLGGASAIASDRETTQSSLRALTVWAAGITPVYLEGALVRALGLAEQPSVLSRLEAAEYDALDDAERLEAAADLERVAADADEAAAAEARLDAERLRRDRLATESVLAATEEAVANRAAEVHLDAAREARAVAADAGRRSRSAQAEATSAPAPKRRSNKKK
jgi:hypothetical protein